MGISNSVGRLVNKILSNNFFQIAKWYVWHYDMFLTNVLIQIKKSMIKHFVVGPLVFVGPRHCAYQIIWPYL